MPVASVDDLLPDMVPSRAGAAAAVVSVANDPDSSASDLARTISCDPGLTSRVLALANSAYYGLSGRVTRPDFAVSVVGFDTVRALACTISLGLDDPDAVPAGFWDQACITAASANVLAACFGAVGPDAFCLGLLHTIGSAMLHKIRPVSALCLPLSGGTGLDLCAAERAEFGADHAEIGARILGAWNFPPLFCELIGRHDQAPPRDAAPLARALHAARVCTSAVLADEAELPRARSALDAALPTGAPPVEHLVARVRDKAAALLEGLTRRQ
jgi:HD-like signal output (HDOD) protein